MMSLIGLNYITVVHYGILNDFRYLESYYNLSQTILRPYHIWQVLNENLIDELFSDNRSAKFSDLIHLMRCSKTIQYPTVSETELGELVESNPKVVE